MTYDNPSDLDGLGGIWSYINLTTGGWFSPLFLLSVYLVVFLYLKAKDLPNVNCAFAAGFIQAILAVFVFALGELSNLALFFCVLAFAIPMLLLWLRD